MQAVGYVRVSTQEQAEQGVSLEAQRAKIEAYCSLKDLNLVKVIADEGISAKNLNRPGFQKVLNMAQKKKIDAVVVYKLDRAFRSTLNALEVTNEFNKLGIGLHSISENLDTTSALGRFFYTLLASLGQMERELIGERTSSALQHMIANGQKTGGYVPYGFDVDSKGRLYRNETEQKGLALIHKLRGQCYSLRAICVELEAMGYKTKNGLTKWHAETLSRILDRRIE